MPDLMVWVKDPEDRDVPGMEAIEQEVRGVSHVSEVNLGTEENVLHVLFEGGRAEQEEIEHAIRQTGYEIFKVSHRST